METNLTKDLKSFLHHVNEVYGEDLAYAMATWNEDTLQSLNCYSSNKRY